VDRRYRWSGSGPNEAFQEALTLLSRGFPELSVVRAQVDAVEDLERRLEQSNAPELLGLAEVAQELGVSKQRVSELASGASFPAPIARLKSGPVWQRSALVRFMRSWKRARGRPARAKR